MAGLCVPLPTLRRRPYGRPAHGSGPRWLATPSSYRTCTDYSLPVSRRTAKDSGHYPVACLKQSLELISVTAAFGSGLLLYYGALGVPIPRHVRVPWHAASAPMR
jgi:hypothetical protein